MRGYLDNQVVFKAIKLYFSNSNSFSIYSLNLSWIMLAYSFACLILCDLYVGLYWLIALRA